ncbi:MAG: tripartite tricarboxylate transporter substrate binding protein [Verrucomicrobiales bacterium]
MPFRSQSRGAFTAALFALVTFASGIADGFPERPVKVIVPFAPGGGSDTFARLVLRAIDQEGLSPEPWVVVNVPGAGGAIGSRRVLNAHPDGHSILFLHEGIVTARYSGLAAYGPEVFEPIAGTGSLGAVICVSEDSPFRTLEELMRAAAADPDTVTFAANIGAPSYFMARRLQHAHGSARFRFVQSGGGARRFSDLKGGHVEASAFSVTEYLNFRHGGLRALAYLGENRHEALPDIPTAKESGIDLVYVSLQAWWAPKGTPDDVVNALAATLAEAMDSQSLLNELSSLQVDPIFLDGRQLAGSMQERSAGIEQLGLEKVAIDLPRLWTGYLALALLGAIAAFVGARKTKLPGKQGGIPDPALSRRAGISALLIAAYLGLLQFSPVRFEFLTFAFILMLTVCLSGRARFLATVAWSLAVPGLCYVFLHRLLGVELP